MAVSNLVLDNNLGLGKYIIDYCEQNNLSGSDCFYVSRVIAHTYPEPEKENVFLCIKSELVNTSGTEGAVWIRIVIDNEKYTVFRVIEDTMQLFHCTHVDNIGSIKEYGLGGAGKKGLHSTAEETKFNFATPLLEMALSYPFYEHTEDSERAIISFRLDFKAILVNGNIHSRYLDKFFNSINNVMPSKI